MPWSALSLVSISFIYRKEKDAVEILDDKTFREELRSQFSKLSIVETMDDYDDEYDDTYDDRAVPVKEEDETERFVIITI